jgi:hypothetical protein
MFTYRGRVVNDNDIAFINELIARNPGASRWALSRQLCREWHWVQPNGELRDMVCRGMMLELHREGHIRLPEKKRSPRNPLVDRKKPEKIEIEQRSLQTELSAIRPLTFRQVRRSPDEKLFNSLIEQFHYLGYCHPVGEQLKYIVHAHGQPVACLAWSSAPRHIASRDRFIGWTAEMRRRHLCLMACNTRFLILPWVRVPSLASHILSRMARILPQDWHRIYRHKVYYLETFVDKSRFAGTCYRAANWRYLGDTTGRGKNDQTRRPNRSIKAVWGYPLTRGFRSVLCGGAP